METEGSSDVVALRRRIVQLEDILAHRTRMMHGARQENARRALDNEQLRYKADRNYQWFAQAHAALELLRKDVERAFTEGGVEELHKELVELRNEAEGLRNRRKEWAKFGRLCATGKQEATQRARDLKDLADGLRERLVRVEQEREGALAQAAKVITAKDARLDRIKEQCVLWHRGEVGAVGAIAGVLAEMRDFQLPEPGSFERAKAVKDAELRAEREQLARVLDAVNHALEDAGIDYPVGTAGVRALMRQRDGAHEAIDEWKTHEAAARGAAMCIAQHFGVDENVIKLLAAGEYIEAVDALTPKKDQGRTT